MPLIQRDLAAVPTKNITLDPVERAYIEARGSQGDSGLDSPK
jgi:hypothetical protein